MVDCLEDPDDTLKLKTLELLYKMTRANNVEVSVRARACVTTLCARAQVREVPCVYVCACVYECV